MTLERLALVIAALALLGLSLLVWHLRRRLQDGATLPAESVFKDDAADALRQRNAIFAKVFNLVPDTLTITRIADGKFVEVNQNWEELTGFTYEEAIGHTSAELGVWVIPEQRAGIIESIQRTGEARRVDVTFRHKKGHLYYVVVSAAVFEIDGEKYMMLAVKDVSEQRAAEQQIREINQQLEERVRQRTQSLAQANEELAQALESLKRTTDELVRSEKMAALGGLVAGVAHEINTPIGIGVTAASHLAEKTRSLARRYKADELRREDMEDYLELAGESTEMVLFNLQRAAELIRSFKQVAVDQSGGQMRRFYVKEYLQEVIRSLTPQIGRTGHAISVVCPEQLKITSLPGDFSQILTNLVMNSVIHGFEGIEAGHIRIEVSEDGGRLLLRYTDDGKGIAPEHLPHIFEPFFTTRRGQGGSGLGLHVVYNIVTQSLGGRIDCASTPGKGVVFEIRIPTREGEDGIETEAAALRA